MTINDVSQHIWFDDSFRGVTAVTRVDVVVMAVIHRHIVVIVELSAVATRHERRSLVAGHHVELLAVVHR